MPVEARGARGIREEPTSEGTGGWHSSLDTLRVSQNRGRERETVARKSTEGEGGGGTQEADGGKEAQRKGSGTGVRPLSRSCAVTDGGKAGKRAEKSRCSHALTPAFPSVPVGQDSASP